MDTARGTKDVTGRSGPRTLVTLIGPAAGNVRNHEAVTRREMARRLAGLLGFDFAGEYEPAAARLAPLYFVPGDTLVAPVAAALGIDAEDDLYGAVVPHAFVATKAITHPLPGARARTPPGWSQAFARAVRGVVLRGFTAFSREDALAAGRRLLATGPVRVKRVSGIGGSGQSVVDDLDAIEAALDAIDDEELRESGFVLEENLDPVSTLSVGQVKVAGLVVSYFGRQQLTRNHSGHEVYGGSELVLVRGDYDALLAFELLPAVRTAITQARAYEAAALSFFPGIVASRRNYDVAQGLDRDGRARSGVLEQSWRIGGASGAEVLALEAFKQDPGLAAVRASSVEVYGDGASPPGATVWFSGEDERVGRLTKYTVVEAHGHA
jgi:hypothetical protein